MYEKFVSQDALQSISLRRALLSAGFTEHDIAHIIKEPHLAHAMLAVIHPEQPSIPSWDTSTDQQLARAQRLWPHVVLPEPPKEFIPRTKCEVLLLHIPDTIGALWRKIRLPDNCIKQPLDQLVFDQGSVRLAPNRREYDKPVWLGFDYEHGRSARPDALWSQPNLAASEVLSAMIQFPNWPLAWLKGAVAPNLAGFQHKSNGRWCNILYLPWCQRGGIKHLEIHSTAANCANNRWSSPTIREC